MKKRVVVEDSLSNMRNALEREGYQVMGMEGINQNPDAIVLTGGDENVMGMEDMQANVPVIDARGMDINQLSEQLGKRLNPMF